MRNLPVYFLWALLLSCNEKKYDTISDQYFQTLSIRDTLLDNKKVLVLKVGDSVNDDYTRLLVRNKQSDKKYLFEEDDCVLENDSIILANYTVFIYGEDDVSGKNGLWVYTKFYTKGTFPFTKKGMEFNVDSVPQNWKKEVPTKEGIYFYKNGSLSVLSTEQSDEKFREKEWDGFYFIPNTGRLFDRINIYKLE